MRVRLIRPAYWTDADLHLRLSAEQREFYIGLWMLADDSGYVSWEPSRVGAELYPYRSPAWRAKHLPAWLEELGPQHARLLACGRHVVVPNLPKYQSPPRPSSQIERQHHATCSQVVPPVTTLPHVAARGSSTEEGKGREGKGIEGGALRAVPENGATDASEFRRRVPRP